VRNVQKRAEILEKLKRDLDPKRFKHCVRAEATAVSLAKKHGVSIKLASIAALLHDYARKFSRSDLLKQAIKFRLKIDAIGKFEPKLFHAELSALLARQEFGITSFQILNAIKKHTVGSPKMTTLEKIIYLSDHIEAGRSFSGVKRLRKLAFTNLDRAVVESASNMLLFLLGQGLPIYPGTIATRNYYLLRS